MHRSVENLVLVDGHVHIYDCFRLPELFEHAYRNFGKVAQDYRPGVSFNGVLMLSETSTDHWFQRLQAHASGEDRETALDTAPWRIQLVSDSSSLLARRDTGQTLILVAGRQVITSEGLELLALATDKKFEDGRPLEEVLQSVRAQNAIPIVPWAFGKWWGKRGTILTHLLAAESGKELFLGDNGGRPVFLRSSSHFARARATGVRILRGSDPLPFEIEMSRIGSFGFWMNGTISDNEPAVDIKRMLRSKMTEITSYGHLARSFHFISSQLRLRLSF